MITPRGPTEKPSQSITPKQDQYKKESPYQNDPYHHETKSQLSSRKGSLIHSMNKMRQNQDVLSQTASQQSNLLLQRREDMPETNKEWLQGINDKLGLKKEFRIVPGKERIV